MAATDWNDCAEKCLRSETCIAWHYIKEEDEGCVHSTEKKMVYSVGKMAGKRNTCLGKIYLTNFIVKFV